MQADVNTNIWNDVSRAHCNLRLLSLLFNLSSSCVVIKEASIERMTMRSTYEALMINVITCEVTVLDATAKAMSATESSFLVLTHSDWGRKSMRFSLVFGRADFLLPPRWRNRMIREACNICIEALQEPENAHEDWKKELWFEASAEHDRVVTEAASSYIYHSRCN